MRFEPEMTDVIEALVKKQVHYLTRDAVFRSKYTARCSLNVSVSLSQGRDRSAMLSIAWEQVRVDTRDGPAVCTSGERRGYSSHGRDVDPLRCQKGTGDDTPITGCGSRMQRRLCVEVD